MVSKSNNKLGLSWTKLSSSEDWTLFLFSVDFVSLDLFHRLTLVDFVCKFD